MNIDLSQWKLIKMAQIEDEFNGFDDEMLFELTDGTCFYQSEYKYKYHYAYRPIVKIYTNGYKTILVPDGMNDYVVIQQATIIRSKIISDFRGWSGNTIFELQNGQVWKQDKYQYKYFYAYRPNVIIAKIGTHFTMLVKGRSIRVKRL